MSFKRVNPGDSLAIPARAYNAFCDAAEAHQASQHAQTHPNLPGFQHRAKIRIRNDSGADRSRFEVLGLGGPVFTPTDNLAEFMREVMFKGVTPSGAHIGKFAVLLEPIPVGKLGWAVVSGAVQVMVDVQTDGDEYAAVTDGECGYLTSGSGSTPILWAESGTGQKRAVVLLGGGGGESSYHGTLDSYLAYNDTTGVTVSVHAIDGDGEWTDTGEDIENVLPPFELCWNGSLPSGTRVRIKRQGGKWHVADFPRWFWGKLSGSLSAGGAATVQIYTGSTLTDSNRSVYAYAPPVMKEGDSIDPESWVKVKMSESGKWYVTLAPC